jgi:hypothetical protein
MYDYIDGILSFLDNPSFFMTVSTARRTSPRHHLPCGFFVAQRQQPAFFADAILSSTVDLPFAFIPVG